MMITSHELRAASASLGRASSVFERLAERHQRVGTNLESTFSDVSNVWTSDKARDFSRQGRSVTAAAAVIPRATATAGESLRDLAADASNLAEEVAGYERARDVASSREQSARASLRWVDPNDTLQQSSLLAQAGEAATAQRRAETNILGASRRWTSRCRSASAALQAASSHLTPVMGPTIGPVAHPGGSSGGYSGGMGLGDVTRVGWEWGASPLMAGFNERRRTMIWHMRGRDYVPPNTRTALVRDVTRVAHWRKPRTVPPTSPLYGKPRPHTWVSPVIGPTRTQVISGPPLPASATRDVASRIPLPKEAWGRTSRVLGPVGTVATVGITSYDEYTDVRGREDLSGGQKVARVGVTTAIEGGSTVAGGALGAKGGAIGGAAIGTMIFPGVGTAIGAVGGAIVGGIAGGTVGQKIGSSISSGWKKANPFNMFGGSDE